ncbi:MAG TPA: D-sedoheptulose 7-phosphate isomerase [Candidatus Avacidaminococcus intestinavium]|uniref:Phosphoheptose isomerase n=1 Tax=Candidatus Avacidaminococcus intestinavium TaxID=2840684 RepID=A0A9D1MP93_9FIRM|nr:D-sedoheptulose 7-phosphate isomerase [Candidatus Avacidaminococcus intestinavium]
MELIEQRFDEHLRVVQLVRRDKKLMQKIAEAAVMLKIALVSGAKIMFCGNGGSAADAQHWAAEIVGRFQKERPGMPAIALTVDTSVLTAIANDYGYERIFARQVEALGVQGDILVAVSTSGNSPNVLAAIDEAQKKGIKVVGLTAAGGGKMAQVCDICLSIPSNITARAQEVHSLIGHILCEYVEG